MVPVMRDINWQRELKQSPSANLYHALLARTTTKLLLRGDFQGAGFDMFGFGQVQE